MVIISLFFIVTDLSRNPSDYQTGSYVISGIRHDTEKYRIKFNNTALRKLLVLEFTDGKEISFSKEYLERWYELSKPENIGKPITVFYRNSGRRNMNPARVDIDGRTIYGLDEKNTSKFVIILITMVLVVISGIDIMKLFGKNEKEKTLHNNH